MAEEINVRVKHKGMPLAEWNKSTVILMERELGVATDTGEVRVGNGKDKWSALPVIKGEKGEPLKVESTTKNSQGDTIIKFDDGSSATVSKGDKGDSITVESHEKDGQGNTVINFSDGSNITVAKGDSIKVESTSTDNDGNTLVKFSDGSSATIAKGDKGDPLTFDDLTPEQINQIKAQDVDLSNYATKDDLASVDVSEQLKNYATNQMVEETVQGLSSQYSYFLGELNKKAPKKHAHSITDVDGLQDELDGKAPKDHTHDDVYVKAVGVDSEGAVTFLRDGKWYNYNSSSSKDNAVALKDHKHNITDINNLESRLKGVETTTRLVYGGLANKADKDHTHDEYLKKGDPIELTSAQKAELKGADGQDGLTTFIRYANNPSGDNMTASPQSDTTHIGIFSYAGQAPPPTPSVYQWTKIKGEDGKPGNPGTPGRDGTSVTTWVGTQSQYDRIYSKSSATLYLIKG